MVGCRFPFFFVLVCNAILWQGVPVCAQTKKTPPPKDVKPDTLFVIEKPKEKDKIDYSADMKETVIVIYPNDTAPKPKVTYKDTVIILKKGLTKEELAAREKAKVVEMMKSNNFCQCIKMDIDVRPILQLETYLTYNFIFKNNCKVDVWVSSKHFRFTPYNAFDKPVKVLRKLSFVKRYDHPDFVKISPGETYTFTYADDAFFEYDLQKGETYKFVFEHRNFGDRSKNAPEKTYLCNQKRVQMITVK